MLICLSAASCPGYVRPGGGKPESETPCDPWRSTLPDTCMIDCAAAEDMQINLNFPQCKVQI